jgi:hypothetical protein
MLRMRRAGMSLAAIGKLCGGISRQRVSSIIGDVKFRRIFVEEK